MGEFIEQAEHFVARDLRELLLAAWEELVERNHFNMTRDVISSGEYDETLELHGLGGAQLSFKLFGAERAIERWRARRGRRLLKKALGWIDVLLDSLANVVPGAGAIKEFKDATTAAVIDRDGGRSIDER